MIDDRDLIRHLEDGGPELWDRPDPPALDLAAITGHRSPAAATQPAGQSRWRTLLTPRPISVAPLGFAAGAFACIALGLVVGVLAFGDPSSTSPEVARDPTPPTAPTERVTMRPLSDAPTAATAVASVFSSPENKRVAVSVDGLPPLHNGTFYELWALGTKGRMVSLGTLSVDGSGHGSASMTLPVSLNRFPILDLSLERADGNPAHSGHSLLRAPV